MKCANCGADNPTGLRFCEQCAAPFKKRCAQCGFENSPAARFCGECAGALAGNAQPSSSAKGASARPIASEIRVTPEHADAATTLDGERKTVTALFADIKGSMDLMEDLDPEDARAIIDPALKLMIEAAHHYDGYVVQSTGDGIFALFGAPVAHEDHPQRALYAAVRLQDQMRTYADQLRARGNPPIQARVGVNTGEVVVRTIETGSERPEYTPIGHSTSLAARMQVLAPIGSIAVTGTVQKLCAGYFNFKALGPARVRGVSEAVEIFEVTGLGPLRTRLQRAAGRGLTKFVGREREMAALRHAAEQARGGRGQIVAAVAEPGVGKSRLYYEFKAIAQSDWTVLETFSISHGKASAYLPVIDLLRNYFRIGIEDDERTRRERVNGKVLTLDRALEDTIPYLFSLLGIVEGADPLAQMDGQIRKRRTLEAIKRIVMRESLNQPLMIIFEDLHWMDTESEGLLNLIADSIANAPILLLVNYRPEYSHQWNSKSYYTQLRLDLLGQESAEQMLAALLGNGKDLVALKRLIIGKTEGNPFFIEEIVQNLIEEGALIRNGEVKLARSMGAIQIPPMVHSILAARIDRLPPEEKDLLQVLSVLGKEFALSQLKATVAKSDSELERMLADLQLAEFIYEQPTAGDLEYTFKHALTQEVAYNSILIERRKQIHERAAQGIESIFAASLADHYTELAYHYQRSGNATKAVKYLHLAAQQAMSLAAYAEASVQLASALELLRTQPDEVERDRAEIAVRLSLAVCVMMSSAGGLSSTAVLEILERARELCEKIGDDVRLFEVLENLSFQHSGQSGLPKAQSLGNELLRIALRVEDPVMVGRARFDLGRTSMWVGNFIEARQEFDLASRVPTDSRSKEEMSFGNWRVRNRSLASLTSWILGFAERAKVINRESLGIAREMIASPADLIFALFWSAVLSLRLGDPGSARSQCEEAIRLLHERGLVSFLNLNGFWRGWAVAQLGQVEEGLSEMLNRRMGFATASGVIRPLICEGLANVYLANGRMSEGLKEVSDALEVIQHSGTTIVEAELRRLKGELLLIDDNGAEPEAAQCFCDAIEVAHKQSAKSWELRATISLARLLAKQGRRDEARTMLGEIYGWFTEGFDTADLIDAKALLDELAG